MSPYDAGGRRESLRTRIEDFLSSRLAAKLEKLPSDDPKRAELKRQYERRTWLRDAARRVQQIQLATHILKPIHPDAKGTNLYVDPAGLPARAEVGSHVLTSRFAEDVVGNAAALDVYKLLSLEADGRSLLAWLLKGDPHAVAALDDGEEAKAWAEAFAQVTQARGSRLSSHAYAKQVFWLAGEDAADDGDYHLLAPLYASALAHAVFETVHQDRYGEANRLARHARREMRWHDGCASEYPGLAVQRFGGSKPQNVSQRNSARGGLNYLLSSHPPVWTSVAPRVPLHRPSILDGVFERLPAVRELLADLKAFLDSTPPRDEASRSRVCRYVDGLVDALVSLAGRYQDELEPGWSRHPQCRLPQSEKLWLDPWRGALDGEQSFAREWLLNRWPMAVGERFVRWLDAQLRGRLSDAGIGGRRNWKKELVDDEWEGRWTQARAELRRRAAELLEPVQ